MVTLLCLYGAAGSSDLQGLGLEMLKKDHGAQKEGEAQKARHRRKERHGSTSVTR